jgi:hypothetical protein
MHFNKLLLVLVVALSAMVIAACAQAGPLVVEREVVETVVVEKEVVVEVTSEAMEAAAGASMEPQAGGTLNLSLLSPLSGCQYPPVQAHIF